MKLKQRIGFAYKTLARLPIMLFWDVIGSAKMIFKTLCQSIFHNKSELRKRLLFKNQCALIRQKSPLHFEASRNNRPDPVLTQWCYKVAPLSCPPYQYRIFLGPGKDCGLRPLQWDMARLSHHTLPTVLYACLHSTTAYSVVAFCCHICMSRARDEFGQSE